MTKQKDSKCHLNETGAACYRDHPDIPPGSPSFRRNGQSSASGLVDGLRGPKGGAYLRNEYYDLS